MPIEAPHRAWEPAGPDEPHPDVKVAGEARAERLETKAGTPPKPGRLLVVGAITALAVVVGVSVVVLASGENDSAERPLSASVLEPTVQAPADTPPTETADPKAVAEQQRKAVRERADDAARKDRVPSHTVKNGPTPEPSEPSLPPVPAGPPVAPGTAQSIAKKMLPGYGWKEKGQYDCLYQLWNRESGWRTTAGRVDGPYGIPQANPGTKMASAGPKWQTDAATQIRWGLGYVKGRYGSPCGAWAHFQANHWY